jgi:hypothetical protein
LGDLVDSLSRAHDAATRERDSLKADNDALRQQVAALERDLATARTESDAAALREGMDMIRRELCPRGYAQPNLLDAVRALCEDRAHYERLYTQVQGQIDQVKRGYTKALAELKSTQPAAAATPVPAN